MKASIKMQKPNIKRRYLYSDTLKQKIKLFISTKARKCIMKAGSLDKYLLKTPTRQIDSKYGLYLRDLIMKKQKDPNFRVGYILGTSHQGKTRKTSVWDYKQVPAVYMTAQTKISDDHTKYYLRTPHEMSRHELKEMEVLIKEMEEPDRLVSEEIAKKLPEYLEFRRQMLLMQPVRWGIIKRYFQKYKYKKVQRDMLF